MTNQEIAREIVKDNSLIGSNPFQYGRLIEQ